MRERSWCQGEEYVAEEFNGLGYQQTGQKVVTGAEVVAEDRGASADPSTFKGPLGNVTANVPGHSINIALNGGLKVFPELGDMANWAKSDTGILPRITPFVKCRKGTLVY